MIRYLRTLYWNHRWLREVISIIGVLLIGLVISSPILWQIIVGFIY